MTDKTDKPTKEEIEKCPRGGQHDWGGWRMDGEGLGERFCQKCKLGAMAHTMRYLP